MRIDKKYVIEETGGYVRERTDTGLWSWKCVDCSTAATGFADFLEAEEDLLEHAEECYG